MDKLLKAALAAALICPFAWLSQPLLEIDDARYAEVPREMLVSGDWISPTMAGMDYVEKPPLWYWSVLSSYKLLGVGERAARLPLALYSAAAVGATAWLGSWLFAPAAGALAGVLLSASGLFFFLSHYASPDLPLATFLLFSTAFILRALLRPADGSWAGPAAWLAAGLAFMSKGLVGLLFPALWTAALVALNPRLLGPAKAFLRPAGPILFLLVTAPWFVVMESRHQGFLSFFFGEQHFQRYLTPKYNRESPIWFYLAVLPAGLLPWAPAALGGLWRAARGLRRSGEQAQLAESALALWILLVVAFFSTSSSKLATYVLPVFPQAALLAARAAERPPLWARRLSLGLGLIFSAAALAGLLLLLSGYAAPLPAGTPVSSAAATSVAAATFALLSGGLLAWGAGRSLLYAALCGWGIGFLGLYSLTRAEELVSAKTLGRYVAEISAPGDELWTYGVYLHGLPFYAGRRVDRVINWVGELHYAKRNPANAARFDDDDVMRKLPLPDRRVVIVLRDFEARHVLTLFDGQKVLATRPVGRWVVLKI